MQIIERAWRLEREIDLTQYSADRAYAERHDYPTREWNGTDRDGHPLLVAWVTNPRNGDVLSAYEISRADETPRTVGLADRRWDCRNDDTE